MSERGAPGVFISPKEAARLLGCSARTLETHRRQRVGVPYFQPRAADGTPIGRPRYLLSDVLEAVDAARVETFGGGRRAKPAKPARQPHAIAEDRGINSSGAEDY